MRLTKEIGRQGYFEIVDRSTSGHIVVDRIILSDAPEPPEYSRFLTAPNDLVALTGKAPIAGSVGEAYRDLFLRSVCRKVRIGDGVLALLSPSGRLEDLDARVERRLVARSLS